MFTRKQIVGRALAVGIVAGLVAGGAMVWHQRSLPPPPIYPITLPETVAWANRSVTRMPNGEERRLLEAFVADGRNYRLEVGLPGRRPVVWVFDGKSLGVSDAVPPKPAAELDPRNTVLGAYESFPSFRYGGVKKVGTHLCWYFEQDEKGVESRLWVDVQTHVPRQVIIRYADGRSDTQTYVDLPAHRTRQPGLYDTYNLRALLTSSAEAMSAP